MYGKSYRSKRYLKQTSTEQQMNNRNDILSSVVSRVLELEYPVYLTGLNLAYPPSSTGTYAAMYSVQADDSSTDSNCYVDVLKELSDEVNPFDIGRSREFRLMSLVYSHCRIVSIELGYVRDFVDPTALFNLPTISLGVFGIRRGTVDADIYDDRVMNYYRDGNAYYQPVNTVKDIRWVTYTLPKLSFSTKSTGDLYMALNDWIPVTSIKDHSLWVGIGQGTLALSSVNTDTYIRQIGRLLVRLNVEFGLPQINNDPSNPIL